MYPYAKLTTTAIARTPYMFSAAAADLRVPAHACCLLHSCHMSDISGEQYWLASVACLPIIMS